MPRARQTSAPDAAALAALPLVGAVAGGLAGCAGWLASRALPRPVAAACALGVSVVVTGAIHLDGFLDGCDAFFVAATPERRLEILKDPHHGTFAVAGMFVAGTLWYAALLALEPRAYPATLAFAAALARAAALPAAFAFPTAASGRTTPALQDRPPLAPLAAQLALLCGYAVAASASEPSPAAGAAALALVPGAVVLGLILSRAIAKRLGGALVGDAYGFTIVVLEIVILGAATVPRPAG